MKENEDPWSGLTDKKVEHEAAWQQRLQDCLTGGIQKWMNLWNRGHSSHIFFFFLLDKGTKRRSSMKLDGRTREAPNQNTNTASLSHTWALSWRAFPLLLMGGCAQPWAWGAAKILQKEWEKKWQVAKGAVRRNFGILAYKNDFIKVWSLSVSWKCVWFRGKSQPLFVWLFCCDHKSRILCCLWQDRWLKWYLIQD